MNTMQFIQAIVELPNNEEFLLFVTNLKTVHVFMGNKNEQGVWIYKEATDKDIEIYNKLPITKFTPATEAIVQYAHILLADF